MYARISLNEKSTSMMPLGPLPLHELIFTPFILHVVMYAYCLEGNEDEKSFSTSATTLLLIQHIIGDYFLYKNI